MSKPTGAEATSYAGAAVSIGSSLTLTQWGIVVGIATALLTFALNLVFAYRKDQREKALYEAELARLRGE